MHVYIQARKILHYMGMCACMFVCSELHVCDDLCTHMYRCMWAKARGQMLMLFFSCYLPFCLDKVSHRLGTSQVG